MATGLITEFLGEGAAASRPVTPDIPSGAVAFWYSTDDDELSVYAEGAWIEDILGGAASTTQTTEGFPGGIGSPSDKSYTIGLNMPHGGTITSTTTKSLSGTCTATFKIGSTALGGTANSVSSSEQSQAHASNNVFAAGDDLVLTISSNSSCVDLAWMIKYTRTLE